MVGGGVHRACISLPRHSSPHATPPRLPVPTPETHSASEASPLVSASVWATHWAPGCGLGLCRLVPDSSAAATAGSSRRAAHRAWYLGEQDRQAQHAACRCISRHPLLHLTSPLGVALWVIFPKGQLVLAGGRWDKGERFLSCKAL